MDFLALLFLVFVGLPILIGFLLYFIPKKLRYPKAGKYLLILFGIFIAVIIFIIVFEDKLFTKNDAKELVEEQEIKLINDFDLIENKSSSAIGDYYHTFTLKISERDKQNIISKIKSSNNFKTNIGSVESLLYLHSDRYFGTKIIQNYETKNSYVREYFKPSGQKGYAPTFRRICIDKKENTLTFEDIDE